MNGIFDFLANRLPLGPLSFQLGPALAGLLAALIPLVIHLSRSRRTKKMRFSTTRFFTDQFLRSYRMSRIREVLLLLCRMALFALLGFGLAQPLLSSPAMGGMRPGGSRAVVLVIDDSASMAYTEGGTTLLARACESAKTVLAGLRPGDSASLILAGRRAAGPLQLFDRPTVRRDDVTQALDGVRPSGLSADLPAAILVAEAQARAASADARAVYVFSDLQETSWPERPLEGDPGGPALVVVQVRPTQPVVNVGVTAVQLSSSRPTMGTAFTVRPKVSVAGEVGDPPEVQLFVDDGETGKPVQTKEVEMAPGGLWGSAWLRHTFATAGWHSGKVEATAKDDRYPADNARYFVVEVVDPAKAAGAGKAAGPVKILAVDGGPSAVEREDALFFLQRALTAAPEGQKSPIEVEAIAPDALDPKDLSSFPVVILADVGSLSPQAVTKLEDYVAAGGSVFIFLGARVQPAFYNDNLLGPGRRDGGLLPGRLLRIQGAVAPGNDTPDVAFLGAAELDHPALAPFRQPGFGSLVGPSVTFKALWEVDAPPETVLMKASTGAPLLCEKAVGKGRVLLFTSSPDRSWTNFPIRPSLYLPWTRQFVEYLAQGPVSREPFHLAGDTVELTARGGEATGPLLVEKPDKHTAAARWNDATHVQEFAETEQPGVYTVKTADDRVVGKFAVNTENYESQLEYLDTQLDDHPGDGRRQEKIEAGLRKRLANRPLAVFVDDPSKAALVGGLGDPNVWVWVLLGVLAVAVAEPTLANRISALLYSRPRAAPAFAADGRGAAPAPGASPQPEASTR